MLFLAYATIGSMTIEINIFHRTKFSKKFNIWTDSFWVYFTKNTAMWLHWYLYQSSIKVNDIIIDCKSWMTPQYMKPQYIVIISVVWQFLFHPALFFAFSKQGEETKGQNHIGNDNNRISAYIFQLLISCLIHYSFYWCFIFLYLLIENTTVCQQIYK